MTLNSPKRPPYWNSTSAFDFDHNQHSGHVILHQSAKFYPNRNTLCRNKTSCRFSRWRISAILDFRVPIMVYLKSPCTTSYRLSIETMALNCLVFEKIAFCNLATDRQTNRWTRPSHEAALTVASGGLIITRCTTRSMI